MNQIVPLLEFESSEVVLVAPTFVLNEISDVHQQITNILALDHLSLFGLHQINVDEYTILLP